METLKDEQKSKTINSRYSLVVTHPTTNLPAHGLSTAERTGSPVFHVLWSIAKKAVYSDLIKVHPFLKPQTFFSFVVHQDHFEDMMLCRSLVWIDPNNADYWTLNENNIPEELVLAMQSLTPNGVFRMS